MTPEPGRPTPAADEPAPAVSTPSAAPAPMTTKSPADRQRELVLASLLVRPESVGRPR